MLPLTRTRSCLYSKEYACMEMHKKTTNSDYYVSQTDDSHSQVTKDTHRMHSTAVTRNTQMMQFFARCGKWNSRIQQNSLFLLGILRKALIIFDWVDPWPFPFLFFSFPFFSFSSPILNFTFYFIFFVSIHTCISWLLQIYLFTIIK